MTRSGWSKAFATALLATLAMGCGGDDSSDASGTATAGSVPPASWVPPGDGTGSGQPDDPAGLPTAGGAVEWETDYDTALARAVDENKPVLVMMTRPACPQTTLLCETVLSSPELATAINQRLVPLVLDLDVINVDEIERRAGRPELSDAEAADHATRLAMKNAIDAQSFRDPHQPPFLAILDSAGQLVAVETGLLDAQHMIDLIVTGLGTAIGLPDPAALVLTPAPRAPAGRLVAPYQAEPAEDDGWTWATGNGAAGEAPDGVGLSALPDPFIASSREHGLAGFSVALGRNDATEVGQIVLSAGGTGFSTMNFSNPPLLVQWGNSGEGIMYYQPVVGPDIEDVDYRVHDNLWTVLTSASTDTISIVGCPPAHRHYNGTVRVGRQPMGVTMSFGPASAWAFVASPLDGTIAAVFLDAANGEDAGDRIGETVYFDAATGAVLAQRAASEQIIDTDGRGGGQEGFGEIPGEPGPVSAAGAVLAPEDVLLVQRGDWGGGGDDRVAWLFVTNPAADSISVFDARGFLDAGSGPLRPIGTHADIEHPRKLMVHDDWLWISNNPGSTVTRVSFADLPTLDAEPEVFTVGQHPMHLAVAGAWWGHTVIFVANSGDDSVTVLKDDGTLVGTLDNTNSAPLAEPYGVWVSGDSLRVMVSNRAGEHATWWNIRRRYEGWETNSLEDVIISSGHVWTGRGVRGIDGDYTP